VRETAFSSARLLQQALLRHGARVYADDPLYSDDELRLMGYTPLANSAKRDISAILVQAAHDTYRDADLREFVGCQVLLDGRRTLSRERVERQGIRYIAIGDGAQDVPAAQEEERLTLSVPADYAARRNLPGGKS
jgi:UDP-N-acetyl-D-mannosaminuronate dehydrogenase